MISTKADLGYQTWPCHYGSKVIIHEGLGQWMPILACQLRRLRCIRWIVGICRGSWPNCRPWWVSQRCNKRVAGSCRYMLLFKPTKHADMCSSNPDHQRCSPAAMGNETCLVACRGSFVRLGPDDKNGRFTSGNVYLMIHIFNIHIHMFIYCSCIFIDFSQFCHQHPLNILYYIWYVLSIQSIHII